MPRKKRAAEQLPPLELAIMHVLWDFGPSTVQQVQQHLEGKHAYTTIQTILNTMEGKGRTTRKLQGKAYIYSASLSRDLALGNAVRDLVERTFKGSIDGLLMNLVKTEQIDKEALERLDRMLVEKESES